MEMHCERVPEALHVVDDNEMMSPVYLTGDQLHIEWHDGRLWLEYADLNKTQRLSDTAIVVSPLQ